MKFEHRVSVVMPAHNAEETIATAVSSVLGQSHTDWELIICDDFSSDQTSQIVQDFSRSDRRISVISLSSKEGPARARNAAIRAATGRWLAFLDSDDWWEADKLEASLAHALEHNSCLTFTSYTRFLSKTNSLGRTIRVPSSVVYRKLLSSNVIATSTVLLDRNQLPAVEMDEGVAFDDFALWLEVLREGRIAHGLDRPLTFYRVSSQSFSSNKLKAAVHVWTIFRQTENLTLARAVRHFLAYSIRGLFKHLLR